MQVKFIGNPVDPSDNRGFIVWAGERFDLNIPRDLPDGKVFAKILTNSHFVVVEPVEPPAPVRALVVDPAWDHDPRSDSKPDAPSKDELIAKAGEIGVKIDKRWSAEKIAAAISAAQTNPQDE